ncbi:protein N-acetylglucosaminyltransferase [Aureococcus anophagefferens]|uniref:protein O-GlcNAc transferase n=1 Tax=Aureococcus anophagefferens TaxID=44056 RepID=A0ABR1FQG0_AURAN
MASPSAATPAAATRAEDAPPPGHRTPAAGPAHKPPGASPAASESPLRPGKENSTPGSDERLLLLGAVHFQLGRWEDCARHTLRCIKRAPGVAESYSNLANALKELGDPSAPWRLYLKAIALKPRFTDAYNNFASAHLHLGETREALETYEAALLVDPTLLRGGAGLRAAGAATSPPPLVRAELAAIYKERGRLDDAAAYYREAIRRKPSAFDAHSNLGNVLKEQGKVDAAIAEYARAIELNPGFAVAHGNLASCYFEKGDLERAIRIFRVALDIEPNFPDACNNLGNALREHGDLEEAIACYRRALLRRTTRRAHNNLGAMKDKGLVNEAIQCYATAVGLAPRFAAAHSNLGLVLKERGTVDDALAHYREAIAVDPQFADAYSNMGNAYKDLGRLDDAIRCYGEALKLRPDFADARVLHGLLRHFGRGLRPSVVAADAVVVPRDHARHYSEKVCRVPHSYFVNDHAQSASYIFDAAALPKRADYGVPERASFAFCNFNQIYKIDPGILDVWCRILTRVDGSILWLLRFPPTGEANIREALEARRLDDRIHFTAVSAKDEHIKRGVLADLFSTRPSATRTRRAATSSGAGAPWSRVPRGKMAARRGVAPRAAGLADLVAPDLGGYEELAVALATDKERYAAVRRRAEACRGASRAPLWDTLRWVRNVERGYGAMWATHEAGAPPADIDVDDPPQRPPQPIQPPGLAALGPVGPHVAGVLFPPAPLFPPPFPAYGAQLRQPTYFLHQGNAVPPQRLPTPPAHYLQTPNAGFALYPPAALNQTDHVWSPRMHQPVFATRPPPRLPGEYAPFG